MIIRFSLLFTTCLFGFVQCEDEPVLKTRTLQFHEIEAPETVSASAENFTITLKNTCIKCRYKHNDEETECVGGNHPDWNNIVEDSSDCNHTDRVDCYERFSWDAAQTKTQIELRAEAIDLRVPGEVYCAAQYSLDNETYQINGPFQAGDFKIIVHQPDGSTVEKTIRMAE